jgi:hypothetical protein
MKDFHKNGWELLTKKLPKDRIEKIENEAAKEIFQIRLSELRRKNNIRQTDVKSFSQSALSKLEARKDMKISTLIEYMKNINMSLEIKAFPRGKHSKADEAILVKI